MSTLYITEYRQTGRDQNSANIPSGLEDGKVIYQTVSFTASPGVSSAFNAQTSLVRIHTDGICSIKFGTAPTAATTNPRMGAGSTEYFTVVPGSNFKVSAITNT